MFPTPPPPNMISPDLSWYHKYRTAPPTCCSCKIDTFNQDPSGSGDEMIRRPPRKMHGLPPVAERQHNDQSLNLNPHSGIASRKLDQSVREQPAVIRARRQTANRSYRADRKYPSNLLCTSCLCLGGSIAFGIFYATTSHLKDFQIKQSVDRTTLFCPLLSLRLLSGVSWPVIDNERERERHTDILVCFTIVRERRICQRKIITDAILRLQKKCLLLKCFIYKHLYYKGFTLITNYSTFHKSVSFFIIDYYNI